MKNLRIRTEFENDLNLLGIQTYLEKSDKFPKIPICLIIPEYEFGLARLHGQIGSFCTCPY
jgi:hypothetical protein